MEIVELARPGHVEIIGVQIMSKEIQERDDRLLEQMELQEKTQAQLTEEMEKLTKLLLASETAWQQRLVRCNATSTDLRQFGKPRPSIGRT